ncbi:MAG: hypothetical protein JO356_17450, partial [Acidobacteria bacterium]|nr:hypothetical protein [Acidobacteriota bacterium]
GPIHPLRASAQWRTPDVFLLEVLRYQIHYEYCGKKNDEHDAGAEDRKSSLE